MSKLSHSTLYNVWRKTEVTETILMEDHPAPEGFILVAEGLFIHEAQLMVFGPQPESPI